MPSPPSFSPVPEQPHLAARLAAAPALTHFWPTVPVTLMRFDSGEGRTQLYLFSTRLAWIFLGTIMPY